MVSTEIQCPKCGTDIELTKALAEPLLKEERGKVDQLVRQRLVDERKSIADSAKAEAREELEAQLLEQRAEMAQQKGKLLQAQQLELEARKAKAAADAALEEHELRVTRAVDAAKKAVAETAAEAARKDMATEMEAIRARATAAEARHEQAEKAQLDAIKAKQEAEDAKRSVEVEVARRVDEGRSKVRDAVIEEQDREHRLKLAEKEQQMDTMRKRIDELQRAGGAGSQQLTGAVQELDMLDLLRNAFPGDLIERVGKGSRSGADILHTVKTAGGAVAGTILHESKRTQNYQAAWLQKAREDQRNVGADLVLLATQALPAEIVTFGLLDDVWVTSWMNVVPLVTALRLGLLDASRSKIALAGADSTKDAAYNYLTSNGFQQRIQRLVEPYAGMRSELEREKVSATRQFAVRDKQLDKMMTGMSGLYGDLQGIFGSALPVVEQLHLPDRELEEAEAESSNVAQLFQDANVEVEDLSAEADDDWDDVDWDDIGEQDTTSTTDEGPF